MNKEELQEVFCAKISIEYGKFRQQIVAQDSEEVYGKAYQIDCVINIYAAQLGLEPNTPLGQAYLIPYKNKGNLECQFQIGYKGLIDLSYRNPQMQIIQAQAVYENDEIEYELGLNPVLVHRPALQNRGEVKLFYGLFKLTNAGFGFEVMSKADMDAYAKEYSKAFDSSFSPWKSNYIGMAKKTVIKQALKYAPLKTDFRKALSTDETIKTEFCEDMSEVQCEDIWDAEYTERSA